jgi:hypothetical protein
MPGCFVEAKKHTSKPPSRNYYSNKNPLLNIVTKIPFFSVISNKPPY